MKIEFFKYSATGNDFVLIDQRDSCFTISKEFVRKYCARKSGIGADGVLVISNSQEHDFKMNIYNSDGSLAEMCGNGARCCIDYIYRVDKLKDQTLVKFETLNSIYEGYLDDEEVVLKMTELYDVQVVDTTDLGGKNTLYLNTGVPHTVVEVSSVSDVNVKSIGSAIRFDKRFQGGTNVDFIEVVSKDKQEVRMRVYERGVEDETLSCGTGVMAVALACQKFYNWEGQVKVQTRGGDVIAELNSETKEMFYRGKVNLIFSGKIVERTS